MFNPIRIIKEVKGVTSFGLHRKTSIFPFCDSCNFRNTGPISLKIQHMLVFMIRVSGKKMFLLLSRNLLVNLITPI